MRERHSLWVKRLIRTATVVVVAIVVAACSPRRRLASEPMFVHTVRHHGETLGAIAQWYTGSSSHWPELATRNPALDPKRMRRGDKVALPERLVKRTKPLPASFVKAHEKGKVASAAIDLDPREADRLRDTVRYRYEGEPSLEGHSDAALTGEAQHAAVTEDGSAPLAPTEPSVDAPSAAGSTVEAAPSERSTNERLLIETREELLENLLGEERAPPG